ncbi:MAG: 4Fe-4S binding protein [Tepidisphaerales bacterium]
MFNLLFALLFALPALAEDRVERFPAPDFKSGYVMPKTVTSPVDRTRLRERVDVGVLVVFLLVASYLIYHKRSRNYTLALTIAGLLYFGFYRKGCICPIGSIQNVAYAIGSHGPLPWTVGAFFVLPLLFALFYGRVFCSGVCPLGAIQDLVLFKPINVPVWVELPLSMMAWAYLGLAVLFAWIGSDFFICRYDPFVGFFRMSGPAHMILAGGIILALCVFVGRVYCRFFCPYGVLLRLMSKFSRRTLSITPRECVDCRLCEQSCPFGAIRTPLPVLQKNIEQEKRRLVWAMVMVPVLTIGFAVLGYLASGALARMDYTVTLAELVHQEEKTGVLAKSDETRAFRSTGATNEQIYQKAAVVQHRYAVGTPLFGAWMGIAIGGRIVGLLLRRRQKSGYIADEGACVACARCYVACPVEKPALAASLQPAASS